MAKFPLRALGLLLLFLSITVPGCQAAFRATGLPGPDQVMDWFDD